MSARPVVFVGFGVTAPDQKYDDYAGVDVHGKIVLMIYGAPSAFPSTERAYYSDGIVKAKECGGARRGRRYCRSCCPRIGNGIRGNGWFRRSKLARCTGSIRKACRTTSFRTCAATRCSASREQTSCFAGAPKTLDQVFATAQASKPQAFALPVSAHIHTVAAQSVIQSSNIVAELKGSDPALRDQYVVYTAHVDHLGICPAVAGDNVCHGALDNASGTSTLLEIARAYASLPHAATPVGAVRVCDRRRNGTARLRLFRALSHRAAEIDRGQRQYRRRSGKLLPDERCRGPRSRALHAGRRSRGCGQRDGLRRQSRSHAGGSFSSFAAISIRLCCRACRRSMSKTECNATDPKINGLDVIKKWLVTRYHTPLDNMDQPIDFDSAAQRARS